MRSPHILPLVMLTTPRDSIYLRNLQLSAVIGPDAWGRASKTQPVALSLRLCRDTLRAGDSDEIKDTFSYGQMCKEVTALIDGKSFPDLNTASSSIGHLAGTWAGETLHCQVILPKALLRAEGGLGKETVMQRHPSHEWRLLNSQWHLRNIRAACIIGVNPHERLEKQAVSIDLTIPDSGESDNYHWYIGQGNEIWRSIVRMTLEASISGHYVCQRSMR